MQSLLDARGRLYDNETLLTLQLRTDTSQSVS